MHRAVVRGKINEGEAGDIFGGKEKTNDYKHICIQLRSIFPMVHLIQIGDYDK